MSDQILQLSQQRTNRFDGPQLALFFRTVVANPELPASSSPSMIMTKSTSSSLLCLRAAAAQATARIGPLLSVTPRPYRYLIESQSFLSERQLTHYGLRVTKDPSPILTLRLAGRRSALDH